MAASKKWIVGKTASWGPYIMLTGERVLAKHRAVLPPGRFKQLIDQGAVIEVGEDEDDG